MMFNLENTTSKIHWTKKNISQLKNFGHIYRTSHFVSCPQPPLLNNSNVEPAQLAQVEMARK